MLPRKTPGQPTRPLHGPLQVFRFSAESHRLIEEMHDRGTEKDAITLRKGDGLQVVMQTLTAGEIIPEHRATAAETICVLEGAVRVFADDKTATLGPRDIVAMDPKVPRHLEALEDCVLLLHLGPPHREPRRESPPPLPPPEAAANLLGLQS